MKDKIKDLIINGSYSIPKLLLSNYKALNINESELVILIYLLNEKDLEFNPTKIGGDLKIDLTNVMVSIDSLIKNNIITINSKKIDGIRKDIVDLDNLYDKLLYLVINEEKDTKNNETDIYTTFETEFGRTLAPMEYEIIGSWIDTGYSKELILAALKEAVFNGVSNLRYIDKILYEWGKSGIKTVSDVEDMRKKRNSKNDSDDDIDMDIVDWNWFDDE